MRKLLALIRSLFHAARRRAASEDQRIHFYPGVEHGDEIYLTGDVDFGSEPFLVRLGSQITIADGVRFVTHDGAARLLRHESPNLHIYAPISVGDRVFIGVQAILMPGVNIGSDSIVAAGAVVTRDVPPGVVVGGVPAQVIKSVAEYRAGALVKGIDWPVGDYGQVWVEALKARYTSAWD